MGSFLSALGGMGASLIGGLFGQQQQQQNIQFQQEQASGAFVGPYAAALRAAGINPAGGGFSPPTVSMPSGSPIGSAISDMGPALQRAIGAGAPTETKTDQLQNKLLESQITHSDLLNKQLASSMAARSLASPDLPFFGGTGRGIPIPPEDPRGLGKGRPNLWTEYYDNPTGRGPGAVVLLSPDAQRSVFSGVPTAPLYPAIASALVGKNIGPFMSALEPSGGWPGTPGFVPPGFVPN